KTCDVDVCPKTNGFPPICPGSRMITSFDSAILHPLTHNTPISQSRFLVLFPIIAASSACDPHHHENHSIDQRLPKPLHRLRPRLIPHSHFPHHLRQPQPP